MRVLLTKLGLDGHDRGLRMIAIELRDRGAEVVLSGPGTSPEHAAATAIQEDVDVVAVSMLSGSHMVLIPALRELLSAADDPAIVCGGLIPPDDVAKLRALGVSVLASGCSVQQAAEAIMQAERPVG
jgi:methylmalonyl-CoA mutase C-terminal domain/subunit